MHDAFLKSVFADRRMAEILIRRHAPEWATEIDFATLREESTGLVSKKTLQRRHPDMIWSADTVKNGRVLFLLEFQRTVDRRHGPAHDHLYRADAGGNRRRTRLPSWGSAPGVRLSRPLPRRRSLDRPGRVTADLFQRSDPGRYRLVRWREGEGDDRLPDDLTALVLGLARNLSPEDMAVQLLGPVAYNREARRSGPGWIHGRDGGYHVRVEGLPETTDEGRSEDHG